MRLEGKRALVTGGASGIGRAVVERFLKEGAAVAFADIDAAGCKATGAALQPKGRIFGTVGDVSKTADAQRIVQESVAFLGGLDILVNNAGTGIKGTVVELDDDEWERQIAVNLSSVYRMSKYAVPEMIKAGSGSIVNIGSVAGFVWFSGYAAYGASKGGVIQLTRNMAGDFAPHNIRVNSVNPGVIDTPLLQRSMQIAVGAGGDPNVIRHAFEDAHLLKRLGTPDEVANAVLFLASDEALFVTGSALVVDGGFIVP